MTSHDAGAMSYHDVAEQLRAQVESGELGRGERVPSQKALADQYEISTGKARQALDYLTNQGLITGGQGKPRYVRDRRVLRHYASSAESLGRRSGAPADAWFTDVREQGFTPGYLHLQHRVEIVHAEPDIARSLGIEPGALAVVRRRIRTVDGRRDNINDTYYDRKMAEQFPEILDPADVPQGIVALMKERGISQVRFVHELRWRLPTPYEAEQLELPPGVCVLIQMHTGYTDEEMQNPVKTTVTIWPGDSHVIVFEESAL